MGFTDDQSLVRQRGTKEKRWASPGWEREKGKRDESQRDERRERNRV